MWLAPHGHLSCIVSSILVLHDVMSVMENMDCNFISLKIVEKLKGKIDKVIVVFFCMGEVLGKGEGRNVT